MTARPAVDLHCCTTQQFLQLLAWQISEMPDDEQKRDLCHGLKESFEQRLARGLLAFNPMEICKDEVE
jgi:hypothetical protein